MSVLGSPWRRLVIGEVHSKRSDVARGGGALSKAIIKRTELVHVRGVYVKGVFLSNSFLPNNQFVTRRSGGGGVEQTAVLLSSSGFSLFNLKRQLRSLILHRNAKWYTITRNHEKSDCQMFGECFYLQVLNAWRSPALASQLDLSFYVCLKCDLCYSLVPRSNVLFFFNLKWGSHFKNPFKRSVLRGQSPLVNYRISEFKISDFLSAFL
jgi:hypothetical protein